MTQPQISVVDPDETWAALASDRKTILFDVRTRAEWSFVGLPDLSAAGASPVLLEWQSFPTMATDPQFAERAVAEIAKAGAEEAYFICRSGARSMSAAFATATAAAAADVEVRCVNVAEGFEGDLNQEGRRGLANGWKARGLPWRQG